MKPPGELWTLTLRALPGGVPAAQRVRKLLKHAAELGLRAVAVREPTWAEVAATVEEWFLLLSDSDIRALLKETP